jgi:hypothetical protein
MEIDSDVKRSEIESLVRELMEGDQGQVMKYKAKEWKRKVEEATASPTGSSCLNLEKMINKVLLAPRDKINGDVILPGITGLGTYGES